MLAAASAWINDLDAGSCDYWLSFLGKSGTGKTFLLNQLARMWYQVDARTDPALRPFTRWTLIQWPKVVAEAMTRDRNMAGSIVDWSEIPVVFLDEIGADRDKGEWVSDSLARLLSGRVGKPTVVTSNCTLDQIAAIDTRISSRLIRDENVLIRLKNTPDYAMRKAT